MLLLVTASKMITHSAMIILILTVITVTVTISIIRDTTINMSIILSITTIE